MRGSNATGDGATQQGGRNRRRQRQRHGLVWLLFAFVFGWCVLVLLGGGGWVGALVLWSGDTQTKSRELY